MTRTPAQRRTTPAALAALTLAASFSVALLTGCGPKEDTKTADTTASSAPGAAASGGGAPAGDKTFLIGFSSPNKAEPWRQAMNDQITAAAAKHPEFKVVFADAGQDNLKQINQVENFLQQKIDLLIISPNEAAPLTDVVAKAYDKGIPVILLDRKVNGDKYTMWIGGDNVAISKLAGTYAADWCEKNGHKPCNVMELRGLEGTSATGERAQGFREGLAKDPDAKIIASQTAKWLREESIKVSQAMFQSNPNVDVVYGFNDPMAEGAIISAGNMKKDMSKMLFIGIDGLPTPDGGIHSVIDGRIGVTYVYPTGGAQAIDWAAKILEDKIKPPKKVTLDTEQITKDNAPTELTKFGGK